jgi:hypothetical protein
LVFTRNNNLLKVILVAVLVPIGVLLTKCKQLIPLRARKHLSNIYTRLPVPNDICNVVIFILGPRGLNGAALLLGMVILCRRGIGSLHKSPAM